LKLRGKKRGSDWRFSLRIRPLPVDLARTPQAREYLIDIYIYIGFDNPSPAVEAENGYYSRVLEEGLEL
jgi:hypothetical protein